MQVIVINEHVFKFSASTFYFTSFQFVANLEKRGGENQLSPFLFFTAGKESDFMLKAYFLMNMKRNPVFSIKTKTKNKLLLNSWPRLLLH